MFAARIRARPAAEILRLGAIATTFRCPFTLAHRALCAAAILARAAALIVRRPRGALVLFNPLNAPIAVSRALTCCAALSRSAFNCAIMSMCSSPGEDCSRYSKLRGSLHRVNNARKAPSVLCVDELPDMRPRHVKEVWRDRIRREQRCTTPATRDGHSGLPAGVPLQ